MTTARRVKKTSIEMAVEMHARWMRVAEATGYKGPDVLERGIEPLEREITAAMRREGTDPECPHRERYPNKLCRRCYFPPGLPG